jgi:arginyl-tRNA synthetase
MLKKELESLLTNSLKELGFEIPDLILEYPKNSEHGDYASNVSFQLARQLKKAPPLIAQDIKEKLSTDDISNDLDFNPVSGFLNISLNPSFLMKSLSILEEDPHFSVDSSKIILEFVSSNPTGPLHIGHGRWAVMGHAIYSILNYTSHSIATEFYINDAGNQIDLFRRSVQALRDDVAIPEDGYHGNYVKTLAESDEDPLEKTLSLQKETLSRLGVEFDVWFSELTLHNEGKVTAMIEWLNTKNLSYSKDDALWFKSTDFGDDKDRVLIKSDGKYTYFLVDIAYHFEKIKRADKLVNIWGADHHGYVPRVRAAVSSFLEDGKDINNAFKVIIGQLVSLLRDGQPVKMSKRTGEMITLDEVIDDIGVDATRFFLLEKSADTHIEFDLDLAKKASQENPVYYIQYAHARISSVLRKSESNTVSIPATFEFNKYERELAVVLIQLNDRVWESAVKYAPHILVQYCLDVAKKFHLFYHHCPVLNASESEKQLRLFLLHKTQFVLRKLLTILGISAPDSM